MCCLLGPTCSPVWMLRAGHFFHSLCCCLAPHGSEVIYLFFILFFEVVIVLLTACPASAEMKLQGCMSRLLMVIASGTCTALPKWYWKAEAGMLTDYCRFWLAKYLSSSSTCCSPSCLACWTILFGSKVVWCYCSALCHCCFLAQHCTLTGMSNPYAYKGQLAYTHVL